MKNMMKAFATHYAAKGDATPTDEEITETADLEI